MPEMKIPQATDTQQTYSFVPPQPIMQQPLGPKVPNLSTNEAIGNPLRQYFRRAAIHLRLPSGTKFYSPDVVTYPQTGELPVYPMTAIDEITARTPDAVFNGAAVAEIMHSCVPSIIDPWNITTIDLDAILIAIRMASVGQHMTVESRCPECNSDSDYDIDLGQVLVSLTQGNYDKPLVIADLEIKFKPLTYQVINDIAQQQFAIQKSIKNLSELEDEEQVNESQGVILKQLNKLNLYIMLASIEWIRTPSAVVTEQEYIAEFLENCQKNDFDAMNKHGIELRESSQIKPVKIQCDECKHEYEQTYTVNPSDFFV